MPIKTFIDRSTLEPVDRIAGTELVLGSASYGQRYLLIGGSGDTDTNNVLMGGYGSNIKVPEARWQMDITGTLNALSASGVGLYGLGQDVTASLTVLYDESINFLSAAKDQSSDIRCFMVGAPRASGDSGSVDRWGIIHGKGNIPFSTNGQYDMSASVAALHWATAASHYSELSLTYPNLIAFTVDDFQAWNFRVDGEGGGGAGYTREDVRNIIAGCRTHNENFEFWPTHYVGDALKVAIPSVNIGFTDDFPTIADEYIGSSIEFEIGEEEIADITSAKLHFLHIDTYTGDTSAENITKTLFINSTAVYNENVQGDERMEVAEYEVASALRAGTNNITMYVSSSTSTDIYRSRVWSVGDIRLICSNGAEYTMLNGRLGSASFDINGGVPLSSSVPPKYSECSGTWVATGNEHHRYIDELSRTLMYYTNPTGSQKDRLPLILESYARCCPNTKLIHGQQGFLFNQPDFDPETVVEKFKSGSFISNGCMTWNYPLYLQSPGSGVFSERTPTTPSSYGGYFQIGSYRYAAKTTFPTYQLAIRGQYQRFTTTGSYGPGEIYFRISHQGGTLDGASPGDYWCSALGVSGAMSAPVDGHYMHMADDPWYLTSGSGNSTTAEITGNITASTPIVFETNVHSGYGNSYTQVNLSASISTSAGGIQALHRDDFYFESGITGSFMQTFFENNSGYLQSASYPVHERFNNYIIEMRPASHERPSGPPGWYYYRPMDGDSVYVRSEKKTLYYSAEADTWITRPLSAYVKPTITPSAMIAGAHYTIPISASAGLVRAGMMHGQNTSSVSYNWDVGERTSSIEFNHFERLDEDFYALSSSTTNHIRLQKNGTYRIAYGINWEQTGSEPPIGIKASVMTASYALTEGEPLAPVELDSSRTYADMSGDVGGSTYGSNAASFLATLKSTDAIYLYVEHVYGTLPQDTDIVANQAWITIEKV